MCAASPLRINGFSHISLMHRQCHFLPPIGKLPQAWVNAARWSFALTIIQPFLPSSALRIDNSWIRRRILGVFVASSWMLGAPFSTLNAGANLDGIEAVGMPLSSIVESIYICALVQDFLLYTPCLIYSCQTQAYSASVFLPPEP